MIICCVKNPLRLGCFSTCDDVNFGITATTTGIYTAYFEANGFQIAIQKTFVSGETLRFPLDKLNEISSYLVLIFNPLGMVINPSFNDGFHIKTELVKNL